MSSTEKLKDKPAIIIVGASGHAKVVIDIVEKQCLYNIYGLIDSYIKKGTQVLGYEVLGTESIIMELIKTKAIIGGVVAIGDNTLRHQMVTKIKKACESFQFITTIHPNAVIGKQVVIKEGTVIVAGVIINSDSTIESHCIINTKASIGHDCYINAFSSIASGAVLGGGITIHNEVAVGLGTVILGKIIIGEHTVIGAGSLVTKDIPAYTITYGRPAKIIRKRKPGDSYL